MKTAKQAFQKLCRASLLHVPDQTEGHIRAMHTALTASIVDGDDEGVELCEVIEEELERFERAQDERRQDPRGPTLQTARKLRDDPIKVMLRRGAIDKDDEVTIEELRNLRYKLTQGLVPGGSGGTSERVDTSAKTYVHPVEKLTRRQDMIHRHVYKPWAGDHSEKITVGKRQREIDLTPFDLVVMVIEGEATIRSLERCHRLNQSAGELGNIFRTTLRDFAARLMIAESECKVPRRKD